MNNNRDWFQPHKEQYVQYLYEPMKELGQQLFQPFLDRPGNILKVSRIYRDARMHHPTPYKESLWVCIRRDSQWWAENPCLFFEICPEGISYGLVWWHPQTAALEALRQGIAAAPDDFLKLIWKTEHSAGIPLSAQLYKRPKPAPEPRLQPFFSWKGGIACIREEPFGEPVFGPELGSRVSVFLEKLVPLYDFFNQFAH